MVDISRRGFIGTGLAALGVSFLPKAALAAELSNVEKLYVTVTTNAFNTAFGDKLSVQSVKDGAIALSGGKDKFDNLSEVARDQAFSNAFQQVFSKNIGAYSDTVKSEVGRYMRNLPRDASEALIAKIYENPLVAKQGNFWDAMNDDRARYPGKQSAETTNPLFAAIDKLREAHMISDTQAFVSIGKAGNLTVGIKTHGNPDPSTYNPQQTEELKAFHKEIGIKINRALSVPRQNPPSAEKPFKI